MLKIQEMEMTVCNMGRDLCAKRLGQSLVIVKQKGPAESRVKWPVIWTVE